MATHLDGTMPTYTFRCDACEDDFERLVPLAQFDDPQACEACGAVARRIVTAVPFTLVGDGWASKNGRIEKQMRAKNSGLKKRQDERKREAPGVVLTPNVDGERVGSWKEAKDLASSKGKDASTYDAVVRKEEAAKKS